MTDLSPGAKVLKYLILLFNFIFFICGIALIGVGAVVSIQFQVPAHFIKLTETDLAHVLASAPIACIIAGIIIISIVMFGCIGAYKEGACLIGLFATLLIVCCIIEFVAASALATWKTIDGAADLKIQKGFNDVIRTYHDDSAVSSASIDSIQIFLKCCGTDTPADWKNSTHLNPVESDVVIYPSSCCGFQDDENFCKDDMKEFYSEGCLAKFKTSVEGNASLLIGAGVTIGLLQILGVIFSCLLLRKIRASTGYEPQFNNY